MGKNFTINTLATIAASDYLDMRSGDNEDARALVSSLVTFLGTGLTSLTGLTTLTMPSGTFTMTTGNEVLSAGNLTLSDGVLSVTESSAAVAMGTVRSVIGQITASATAIASGTITGVRGLCTLSGTITAGGAFLYGTQGKLVVTGTMNHADSRLCAGISQLDATGGTLTAGQLSGHWIDVVGITGAGGGQFNLLRMTAADAAVPNSLIFAYSNATYAFDLNKPTTGAQAYVAAAGTAAGSAGNAGGAVATRVLICNIAGEVAYIPLCNGNGS